MNRIMGVTELQRHFRSAVEDVVKNKVAYVLTRGSRPEVAMIPYEDYLRFQKLNDAQVLARFDLLLEKMAGLHRDIPDEEIAADLAAARRERQRAV
jgi:prevent-host-death family protein